VTPSSIPLQSLWLWLAVGLCYVTAGAQQPTPPPAAAEKPAEKPATPETPAQIELLETRIRFESNGDSRKEVHTRVRINSELGVRQFSRLNFDFNRSYEQIEIPQVHITHKSGGTADILPGAITDQPNSAVTDAPAYQDVRVKSVRILGLEPADLLEYRVITSTTHHPLAPDFWLDHSFDRTGVVSQEKFELDLPASRFLDEGPSNFAPSSPGDPAGVLSSGRTDTAASTPSQQPSGIVYVSAQAPPVSKETTREGENARVHYAWNRSDSPLLESKNGSFTPEVKTADVVVTTYSSWDSVAFALAHQLFPTSLWTSTTREAPEITEKRKQLAAVPGTRPEESIYDFVAEKIRTVDLPVGSTGFLSRKPAEILSSGYGTTEDKAALFAALAPTIPVQFDLVPDHYAWPMLQLPRPSVFKQFLLQVGTESRAFYLDPSLEVAPFGVVRADLRGSEALMLYHPSPSYDVLGHRSGYAHLWHRLSNDLPFRSLQRVMVDATITSDGTLNAKVKYSMRGDNELLLRVAFHQSPRDKWKEIAQLLALSDGFRGKIISASASDPSSTKLPFTVEYEITQPKFVDWSKKPIRIPALLPQLGAPEPPSKAESGAVSTPIDLGTPLDVDTRATLRLPPGTSVELPAGTVVDRDYATFASRYNTQNAVITASRHINFLHRQVPADRSADYAAFFHAVQTDQAQHFTLSRSSTSTQPATSKPAPHP
jgi:hypothetical protein